MARLIDADAIKYRTLSYGGWACPACHMGVTVDHGRIKDTFCSHCGQAIDWEEA